jgi:hypothetical protein
MTTEQIEILINAYKALRAGEITPEQYQDVRRTLLDELMESE